MNEPMKIYYAHSRLDYGSDVEKDDIKKILADHAGCAVFNPAKAFSNKGWKLRMRMNMMRGFDLVVVREYSGYVGRGVYDEVVQALKYGVKVGVLRGGGYLDVASVRVVGNDWRVKYGKVLEADL